MKCNLFVVIFILCYYSVISLLNSEILFTGELLNFKRIQLSRFFLCWNSKDILNLHKQNKRYNIRSNFANPILHDNLTMKFENYYNKFGYVLDTSCKNWKVLFEKKMKSSFVKQRFWLLLCDDQSKLDEARMILNNIEIRLDSNIHFALKHKSTYVIFEAFNPGFTSGGKLHVINKATYNEGNFNRNGISWYESRKDLSSLKLRIVFVITKNITKPLEYLENLRNKYKDTFAKTSYGIFKHIIEIHNFSWSKVITPLWFGAPPHVGDVGLAKILLDGKADLTAVAGKITVSRFETVDFLIGSYDFKSSFVYRKSSVHGNIKNVLFKPLSKNCWLCFLLLASILCVCLKLIFNCEGWSDGLLQNHTWFTSMIHTLSSVCQQGTTLDFSYWGGRFALFWLLTLSFLLYNYYTSSIVSLLINNQHQPLKTLSDLIHSKLVIEMEDTGYTRTYLRTTHNKDPDLNALKYLKKYVDANSSKLSYCTPDVGIAKVKAGGFAYHAEVSTLYKYLADTFDDAQICDVAEIVLIRPAVLYMISPKHSQYNKLLLISYRKIAQVGILQRQQKRWSIARPRCRTGQFVQVGSEEAAPAFLILTVGICAALILLLVEKWKQ